VLDPRRRRARYYDPILGRFLSVDSGGILQDNPYAYGDGNPLLYVDPFGLWGLEDLPDVPPEVADFSAGFGDTLSLGFTNWARSQLGTNGFVNKCSGSYGGGQAAGAALDVALGGAAGMRAAGAAARGLEFSHWIPMRLGGPRSLWNGNYVTAVQHALSDPYRMRFMPRAFKDSATRWPRWYQQWFRIPNVYKGAAAGAAAGAAGAAASGGDCGCR
jgi:hypothetical protein